MYVTLYCKSFVIKTVLSLFLFQTNLIILWTYSELRYKNITEDKSFSYLTKHAEYLTLTFLIQFWFENKTELTFISNSPLSTWDLYTSNINLHPLILMFYIALDFDFLKIFFDWFTFSGKILSDLVLLWENEYNLLIIGKPRFQFWLTCFVLQKNSGNWRNSIASRKVTCTTVSFLINNFITKQWRNWGGELGAIAPPLWKTCLFKSNIKTIFFFVLPS